MKKRFKDLVVRLLWLQVVRLRKKYKPLVVGVAGSIGKTGTKQAIATVLSQHLKVQWQDGNYNDITSVPLIFFGLKMPRFLNSPFSWAWILFKAELQIQLGYNYEVVVVEIGTDYRGNLDLFKQYLSVDYGVLTGIAPEHMENFADLDDVAAEELTIAEFANTLLVNRDAVDKKYATNLVALTYGEGPYDCRISPKKLTPQFKRPVVFTLKNGEVYDVETSLLGKQNLPAVAAAVTLADLLELTEAEIAQGLAALTAMPGRMQLLKGEKGSLIIDDTYNSSPEAATAALDTLYEAQAKQKIAILGQMNELGKFSKELHEQVGSYCDPKQLDLVVTIGKAANKHLAAAAEKKGCKVMRCPSPYHAADVVRPLIKPGTLILAKGSQNGVFAEEAVKTLLDDPADASKLVRQSHTWLKVKQEQFPS